MRLPKSLPKSHSTINSIIPGKGPWLGAMRAKYYLLCWVPHLRDWANPDSEPRLAAYVNFGIFGWRECTIDLKNKVVTYNKRLVPHLFDYVQDAINKLLDGMS